MKNVSNLTQSDNPRTAGKLCEYVRGASWLASSLPCFAEQVAPLRALLEAAYSKMGGRRTKKSIAKIPPDSFGWNKTHRDAFDGLNEQIKQSTRLTHRDPKIVLCLHTDASDRNRAAAATQCSPEDLSEPLTDQYHQPLAFLSGTVSKREEH